eukprot:TRINITY_DN14318_c0_g1_i1.p1 TRINITY_DN14318_c0_g1~~TRINITY_DN14318_c0_g1_i1.p1  ORF type:complete len:1032 (-),score=263.01 TRINITY_DN14318_c0_g1_i1:64-2724(-)
MNLVEGSISCLAMFSSGENLQDNHLPTLIQTAFPPLLNIVSSPNFSDRVKMHAAQVVQSCIEWFAFRDESGNEKSMTKILGPALQPWLAAFAQILATPDTTLRFQGLKISVLKSIHILIDAFPGQVKKHIGNLYGPIYQALNNCYVLFEKHAVKNDELDEIELEEGETAAQYGLEPYVSALLDVTYFIAYKSKFRPILTQALPQLFYMTIGYMQMTEAQTETYARDPNQWVADEDNETACNIRISASTLVTELISGFKEAAVTPFIAALGKRLQESGEASNKHGWKMGEASVYAFGLAAPIILRKGYTMDWQGFTNGILVPGVAAGQPPFIRGRCLWAASFATQRLSNEQVGTFLQVAANYLNDKNEVLPVKIFACRALSKFCPQITNPAQLSEYLSGLMQGLIEVLDSLKGDTLLLVLHTLHILVALNEEVAENALEAIVVRLQLLWAHNYKDHELVNHMLDLIDDFASYPSCQHRLQSILAPSLVNIIKNGDGQNFYVLETALQIITHMVLRSTWPVHTSLSGDLFPVLLQFMLTSTNETVIDRGTETLRAFARTAGDNILAWKNDKGENGLQVYVQIIARLLSPGVPESAAHNVGGLIEKVISLYGNHLQSVLDDIFTAVLVKLHTTQDLTLKQGLLLVFVRLLVHNPDMFIDYLSSKRLNPQDPPELVYILREWTEIHEHLFGNFKIKLSLLGLTKIFTCNNPNLENLNINVRGDLIASTGRATRSGKSQKAEYAEEPVKLRIFKILIQEHNVLVQNEESLDSSISDSFDDDAFGSDDDDEDLLTSLGQEALQEAAGGNISDPFAAQELFQFLDQFLDGKHHVDEEDEDPDLKNDPIYKMDLKEFVEGFIYGLARENAEFFQRLLDALPPLEKKHLANYFKF